MKILVLGSGADGGIPLWNCSCSACHDCRAARPPKLMPQPQRTQSSVAVSQDGLTWVLLNVSPDINQQIRANRLLQPQRSAEGSANAPSHRPLHKSLDTALSTPIKALVLLDAQWQSVGGLLNLRDSAGLEVFATPLMFEDMTEALAQRHVMESRCSVHWHLLPVAGTETQAEFRIPGFGDLRFVAIALPGTLPDAVQGGVPDPLQPGGGSVGQSIALAVEDLGSGLMFVYAPQLPHSPQLTEAELAWLQDTACLLMDGSAELPLRGFAGRRILTHLSHNNPLLDERSAARQRIEAEGIELAFDGMVIDL